MGSQQGRKRGRDRVRSSLPEGFADCHRAVLNAAAGSEQHGDRRPAVFLFVVRRTESKGAAETATPCRYKFFGNGNAAPARLVLRISAVGVDSGKTRCSRCGTRCVQRVFPSPKPTRPSASERPNIPPAGQALSRKIFRFSEVQIRGISAPVSPGKGAARDRHEPCGGMRRDAVASGDPSPDENVRSVRRSRVVLAPRPWRQADGLIHR